MPLRWAILSLAIFQQLNSTQTILTEAPPCASTALNLGKQSRLSQLQPSVPKTDLQASPGQWYLRCYVGNMCKELRGRVTKSSKHLASAKFILKKKKKSSTGLFKHSMAQGWQMKITRKYSPLGWAHSKHTGFLPILVLFGPELLEVFPRLWSS